MKVHARTRGTHEDSKCVPKHQNASMCGTPTDSENQVELGCDRFEEKRPSASPFYFSAPRNPALKKEAIVRRCKHEIAFVILEEAKEGEVQTNLMFASHTTHKQVRAYLKMLNNNDLLEKKGQLWFTTEKGNRFVEAFQTLQSLMEKRL